MFTVGRIQKKQASWLRDVKLEPYLAGTDNGIETRTWQQAIESLTKHQARSKSAPLEDSGQR
jgi:hypothetical protein